MVTLIIRSQRIAEKTRREFCGSFAFVKQRSPRRRTLGLQSVRAPGGIRTHNLRLRHSCALSVELQTHALPNVVNEGLKRFIDFAYCGKPFELKLGVLCYRFITKANGQLAFMSYPKDPQRNLRVFCFCKTKKPQAANSGASKWCERLTGFEPVTDPKPMDCSIP